LIETMPRKLPMFVYRERTRHGKTVFYFRQGHGKRIRLPDYGSPEFDEAYKAALTGDTVPERRKAGAGSLEWLITQYRASSAYLQYSKATRKQRDNIFLHVIEKSGSKPFKAVTKQAILAGRENRKETPAQARNFLDAMRCLFKWAVNSELIQIDPTYGVENPKRPKTQGFPQWSDEEVEQYRSYWPLGTRQRVWLEVLIGCGARRGDAVRIGKQHVKDSLIEFRTEKSGQSICVYAPIPERMIEAINIGPVGDLTFIAKLNGKNYTKESFGGAFKEACVEAGLENRSAHGLRKTAATIYAEMGLSDAELESFFGWVRGSAMAAHYSRNANTKRLASNAAKRIMNKEIPNLDSAIPHPKKDVG